MASLTAIYGLTLLAASAAAMGGAVAVEKFHPAGSEPPPETDEEPVIPSGEMPIIPSTQLPSGEMPFEKTSPERGAPPAEDIFQQPSAPPFEESEPSAPPDEENPQGGGAVGRPPWEPYTGGPRLDPQTGAPIPGTSITGPSPIKITGNSISKPQQEKTVELYSLTQQIRNTEFEIYDSEIKLGKEKETYKTSTATINRKKRDIDSADRIITLYKEKLKPKPTASTASKFPTDPDPTAFLNKWRSDVNVGKDKLANGKKDAEWKIKLLEILKSRRPEHKDFIDDFNATFPGYDPAAPAAPVSGIDPTLDPTKVIDYNGEITEQEKTKDEAKEIIEDETDKQQRALKKVTSLKTDAESLKTKLEELKKQRDALLKSMEVFGLTKPGMFSSKQTEQPKVTLTADELKLRMTEYTKENSSLEKLTNDWRSFLTEEYLPSRNEGTLTAKEQAELYVRTFLNTYQKHVVLNKRRRLTNENALPIIVKLPEELADKDKDTTDPTKIKVGTIELQLEDVKTEIGNATNPGSKTPDELSFMRQLNAAIADVKRYKTPGVAPPLTKEERVREQQNIFTELLNNLTEIKLTDSQKKKLFDDEFVKLLGNFQVMVGMEELELSNHYETYYENFSKVGYLSKSGEQKMIKTILEFYSLVKPKKCVFQKGDVIDHETDNEKKGVTVLSVKNDKTTGTCSEIKVKLKNGRTDTIPSTDFQYYKNTNPSSDEAKLNSFKTDISAKIDKTIENLNSIKKDEEQNTKHIDALITTVENIKNAFNEGKLPEYAGTLFSILKGAGKTLKPAFIALDLSNPDSKIRKMLDVIGQAILSFGTLLYNLGPSISTLGSNLVDGITTSVFTLISGVMPLIELLPPKDKVVEAINAALDKLKAFGTSVKDLADKTVDSIKQLADKVDILGNLNTLMSLTVFGVIDVLSGIGAGAKATVDQLKKINITNMDDLSAKIWGYTESMASTLKSGFTETKSIEYGEKTRQAIVKWFKTFKFPPMPDFSWFTNLFPSLSAIKDGFIEGLKIAGWITLSAVPAAVGATGYAINWAVTKLIDPNTWSTLYENCPVFIQKTAAFIQTGIKWFMSLTKLIGTILVSFFLMPVATIAGSPIILGLWVVKFVIGFFGARGGASKIKELFSKLWKSKEIEEAVDGLPPPETPPETPTVAQPETPPVPPTVAQPETPPAPAPAQAQAQTNKLPTIKETSLSDKTELVKSGGGTIYTVMYNSKKYIFKNLKEGTSGPNDAIIKILIDNPKNLYTNMITNNTNITSPLFLVENSSNETIGYLMNFLEGFTSLTQILPSITTDIQLKRIIAQLLEGLKSIQKSGTIGCPEHGNNILIKNFNAAQQELTIIDLDDMLKCDKNSERETIETLDTILSSDTDGNLNGVNATNNWLFESTGRGDRKVKDTIRNYEDLYNLVNPQPPAGGYRNHQTIRNSHWRRSLPSRRRTYRTY